MSELKATTIYDVYWKANSTGEGTGTLVYLKSEVDKVIAEKDRVITYARVLVREDLKIIRHNKYTRCLAMAKWCHNQREIYERDSYDWELDADSVTHLRNKANIMRKWRKRWLELAEKFKETK